MSTSTENTGLMSELGRFAKDTKEILSFFSHVGLMYISLKMHKTLGSLNCYQDAEYDGNRELFDV